MVYVKILYLLPWMLKQDWQWSPQTTTRPSNTRPLVSSRPHCKLPLPLYHRTLQCTEYPGPSTSLVLNREPLFCFSRRLVTTKIASSKSVVCLLALFEKYFKVKLKNKPACIQSREEGQKNDQYFFPPPHPPFTPHVKSGFLTGLSIVVKFIARNLRPFTKDSHALDSTTKWRWLDSLLVEYNW